MEGRLDEVRIDLRHGIVSIPWSSRDALLEQLRDQDSLSDVREAFQAVRRTAGVAQPVRRRVNPAP